MTPAAPRRVRSVFVSDLHMGYRGADIAALNRFLCAHDFRHLYLVGDVLDGWKLEKRWYWNRDYSDFVDLLIELRRRRVRITLLTGNHDERLRDVLAILFRPILLRRFGIRIEERIIHRARDGRRYLVMHGDQFDGLLVRGASRLADRAWSWLGEKALVRPRRALTRRGGRPRRWSLGKAIAQNGQSLLARFSASAVRRAARDGVDGIVCGHSHVPGLSDAGGVMLANCGSWTGAREAGAHHTALVETLEGRLELVTAPACRPPPDDLRLRGLAPDRAGTRHADAARLVRLIHALWPAPATASPTVRNAPARPLPDATDAAPLPTVPGR
ncbi:UDP-2,3-diacylglucosamine diphosphatase [Pararhodobacter sp. SW119]|uniref:UDP-2,3-diacylglucosamine diphosphatase n=1 Tax=Pararhodobacter sp. SW119 TaxID=2780075 RepID=UPI001AE0C9A4